MASQSIGTFYGYSNGSAYGRYNCTLYWDNVTRSGKNVTIHNPRVVMTKTDTDKYTVNRIAGYAAIGDQVVKNNVTLNAYQTQSPNSITFSLGTTTVQTTGTSVGIYVALASTGGSSNWNNFQSTPLEWSGNIACPAANPTYTVKPTITNIQETSLVINRGSADITSNFYYRAKGASSWVKLTAASTTLSSLTPNTDYEFEFKAENASLTNLYTLANNISVKTLQYPYIEKVENVNIEVGGLQKLSLYNPLGRTVSIFMTHETRTGTIIYEGSTNQKTHSFNIPEEASCLALGADKTSGNAKYFCEYNAYIVSDQDGAYKITEAAFKPTWDETKIEKIFKYKDGNDAIVAITEDDQNLIQGYSQLYYGVDYEQFPAQPSLGSAIDKYQISINNGVFIDIPNSSATPNINSDLTIPANAINIAIEIKAIDLRGYESNVLRKTLKVNPYKIPYGSIEVYREGGYGETIHLIINPIWSINENNIGQATYKYGANGGVLSNETHTTSFNTPIVLPGFDNESNFNFEVILTDNLGNNSVPITGSLGIGEPILFIDAGDNITGVGVNCFPETKGLYVKGDAVFYNTTTAKENLIVEQNATIRGHLNVGSHRRQYFERDGKPRTGWFYTGGNQ